MSGLALFAVVAGLVMLFVVVELACAILPLLIVVTMVAPEERQVLADLIAAADSSRRLRFWPALRLAVAARRCSRARHRRDVPDAETRREVLPVSGRSGRWRDAPR